MQMQRRSMDASSETSFCERETWDDWGSRSSLSQVEEVATQSSSRTDDFAALKAERDALSRALAAERQRAATAARAHDARLAELHGVIAELVRRRAADKHAGAIPEEEVSDECESTTQPAGELDNDCEQSRTEQHESSSILSPSELTPQEKVPPLPHDTDTSTLEIRADQPVDMLDVPKPSSDNCDTSLNLSERDSEICLSTARCCQAARGAGAGESADSCSRQHGSDTARVYTASPGRCEYRQAKIASRVRLKRTEDTDSTNNVNNEDGWLGSGACGVALDVCAQADLREALLNANHNGSALTATLSASRARCARLQADTAVLHCALAQAADTAHRLYCACAVQESWCVSLCCSLRAADRALETYDVLLALAESRHPAEREAAELVARQLLSKLEAEHSSVAIGEPLLSPGPWLHHHHQACESPWSAECESRLRGHAARLKAETVALRPANPPALFSYHDIEEEEIPKPVGTFSMADMEAAVMLQEVLTVRERRAMSAVTSQLTSQPIDNKQYIDPEFDTRERTQNENVHCEERTQNEHVHSKERTENEHKQHKQHKEENGRERRRARRHWLETQASETDL